MMKLGGWWRLLIVLTAIYGATVATVFISEWPSAVNVPHGPWLSYRMSTDSQRLLQVPSPSMDDLIGSLRRADRIGDVDSARTLAQKIRAAREQPWTLDPIVVTGPNGHSFKLAAESSKVEVAAFKKDYARVLDAEAADLQVEAAKIFMFVLLIPPILLMVLALSGRWVWWGFKRNRGAP